MNQATQINNSENDLKSYIEKRQKTVKLLKTLSIIVYLGMLVIPLSAIILHISDDIYLAILSVACLPGGYFIGKIAENKNKELKEVVGDCIIRGVLSERIQVLEYMPNGYANENFVRNCRILPGFNVIHGSDYIHGIYRGEEFTCSDLELISESREIDPGSNSCTDSVVMFKGSLLTMNARTKVNGFVQIREKKHTQRNNVETSAFYNRFDVSASDDQTALSILTPRFMDCIMSLESHINIEFAGNLIVISLDNGKDLFELGDMVKNQNDIGQCWQKFRNDLSGILRVIDIVMETGY